MYYPWCMTLDYLMARLLTSVTRGILQDPKAEWMTAMQTSAKILSDAIASSFESGATMKNKQCVELIQLQSNCNAKHHWHIDAQSWEMLPGCQNAKCEFHFSRRLCCWQYCIVLKQTTLSKEHWKKSWSKWCENTQCYTCTVLPDCDSTRKKVSTVSKILLVL